MYKPQVLYRMHLPYGQSRPFRTATDLNLQRKSIITSGDSEETRAREKEVGKTRRKVFLPPDSRSLADRQPRALLAALLRAGQIIQRTGDFTEYSSQGFMRADSRCTSLANRGPSARTTSSVTVTVTLGCRNGTVKTRTYHFQPT